MKTDNRAHILIAKYLNFSYIPCKDRSRQLSVSFRISRKPKMLCLFLLFGSLKRSLQNTYPSTKRLSRIPLCRITVRLLWGFAQISLALLCILLKLNFLDIIHVAYVVVGLGIVGGEQKVSLLFDGNNETINPLCSPGLP